MLHFGAKEIITLLLIVLIPQIIFSQKDESWGKEDEIRINKALIRARLKRNVNRKTVGHIIEKKRKKHSRQVTDTRTIQNHKNKTVNRKLDSGKRHDPHNFVDLTEYLRGDGVQQYPVPMSNPDPFNDLRHHRAYFGPDLNHFEGDPVHPPVNTGNGLTPSEVLHDASTLAAQGHDIRLDTGCSESCRLLAEDRIVDGERADAAHLLQEANMIKENSRMMAAQASHLEHEALMLGKPAVGGSVTGYSQHMLDASVNADKPLHIPSGHGGEGPERGGTLDLEHNALHYGHHNADDAVQVSTGYPIYHLPTEQPHEDPTVDFVRPLPPVSGPNPYEVLTSSPLIKEVPVEDVHDGIHHLHHGMDPHTDFHGHAIGVEDLHDGIHHLHHGMDPHTGFHGHAIGAGLNAHLETSGQFPGHRQLVIDLPDLPPQHGRKRSFRRIKRKRKLHKKKNKF